MLADLRSRVRAIFRRPVVERELGEELQFHLDQEIDKHVRAGLTPQDARRRALADLGGIESTREAVRDARGTRTVDALRQDLRYAVRVMTRTPGFTVAVVLTLALGIGATATMFAVVDGVLLRPLPYADADRIAQIGRRFGPVQVSATSAPDYFDLQARPRPFAAVAIARTETVDISGDAAPERVPSAIVSSSFFDVLGVAPAHGRVFAAADDRPDGRVAVVLSHRLWARRYGADPALIGRVIVLNGVAHAVLGIMPRGFDGPEALGLAGTDVWRPLGRVTLGTDREDAAFATLARLAPGVTSQSAAAELTAIGRAISGTDAPNFWTAPLRDRTVGDAGTQLWLLFAAVALLLLIACSNVANLFLVRATERTRELALRTAIGASRGRIARQLLTESIVFTLTGGAIGVALAYGGVALLRAWTPAELPRVAEISVDTRVLLFALLVSVVAGVAFGLVPAAGVLRSGFATTLRSAAGNVATTRFGVRLRGVLVIVQTTMAVVLLTGAAILAHSVWRLAHVAPGFDPTAVVWLDVSLPERTYPGAAPKLAFFDALIAQVSAMPGVSAVSAIQGKPLGGGNSISTVAPEGPLPEGAPTPRVPFHVVAPGYFATLAIPQLDGRDFNAGDTAGSPRVAIVNRAFAARFWPEARAVGKRFWMGRVAADAPLTEIVGVVEDVRQYGLDEPPQPTVYRSLAQVPRGSLSVVARHDGVGATSLLQTMRGAAAALDSSLPLGAGGTMDAQVATSIRQPRYRAIALAAFAVCAAVIAFVGLYGTLAWIVRARRRELGIRLVLGADARDVSMLVIRRGLMMAATGVVLGLAGAAAASRAIASLVFGISPMDLPTFFVVGASMLILALVASWVPARRAGAVNPLEVLQRD
jgi:putative ABC transport system permease protein